MIRKPRPDLKLNITQATAQGSRSYQEDRMLVCCTDKRLYFVVADGHGGDEVAQYVVDNLPRIIKLQAVQQAQPRLALHRIFYRLHQGTKNLRDSGAAVSIVCLPTRGHSVRARTATVAILGDAPVIIKDEKGNISRSPEHNVRSNYIERDRAIQRGGYVSGGYLYQPGYDYGLQMSRALGDRHLDKVLERVPEIYTVVIGPNSWILVGSDGLCDPAHQLSNTTDTVAGLVDNGATADQLVQDAVDLPTDDNVTAILWRAKVD